MNPIFSALVIFFAPIFVPTIAVIAVPIPNTIGIIKNSTLDPIPYPARAELPNCPIRPVSIKIVPTVNIGDKEAGKATLKISLNSSFSRVMRENFN